MINKVTQMMVTNINVLRSGIHLLSGCELDTTLIVLVHQGRLSCCYAKIVQ